MNGSMIWHLGIVTLSFGFNEVGIKPCKDEVAEIVEDELDYLMKDARETPQFSAGSIRSIFDW